MRQNERRYDKIIIESAKEAIAIINISANETIYNLIKHHPVIKDIMKEAGFVHITNPVMLGSAGKVITLNSGIKMRKIAPDLIRDIFQKNHFRLVDLNNE